MQDETFQSPQAREIINYIRENFGDELEFLWQKFPGNAIVRNSQNRKWYAAFLIVSRRKLGLDSDEEVEILDIRFDRNEALVFAESHENVYPGYHMNKNNWITIILDGSMSTEQILGLVEHSYDISLRK